MRAWTTAVVALSVAGLTGSAAAQLAPGGYDRSQFSYGGFRGMGSPIRSSPGGSHHGHSGHGHSHHGHGHHGHWHHGHWHGHGGFGWGAPWLNPPIYVFPSFGYGGSFGYGSAYPPAYVNPLGDQLLQQQYEDEWNLLSARLADLASRNAGDPTTGNTAVPVPSTPEAKIKSMRYQAQGDDAFRAQEYHRAYDRYKLAASAARDNSGALLRTGYALVALGRYTQAIEYFKRGLRIEPSLAHLGPGPSELYGDNNLAWASHLSKVTHWVREDVRDAQRVLLMGMLLKFDGDTRAEEFLERAWQLSGGTETAVVTLLSPPAVAKVDGNADPLAPAGDPAIGGGAAADADEGPLLGGIPPAGEAVPPEGADRDVRQVPEPPAANRRFPWEEPLFPLPSEQSRATDGPAIPPLPADVEN